MKRVILLLAVLTGLAGSNPLIFGPAGMPSTWTLEDLIISGSLVTDSAAACSLKTDSLRIGAGTTGSSADVFIFFNGGETVEWIKFDDGTNAFATSAGLNLTGNIQANNTLDFYATNSTIDPENSGRGSCALGMAGDADIIDLQGELHFSSDAVATYDTTSTVANGVHLALLNAAAGQDTLNLPAAASHSGRVLIIKCIHADGGHVDGNGAETIDGSAVQDLAQWDSITIYCNGTTWYIL